MIDKKAESKPEPHNIEKGTPRGPFKPVSNSFNEIQSVQNNQIRYTAFKYKTSHKVWPLQAPALKDLDDMLLKENHCTSTVPSAIKSEKQEDHNLIWWSLEPRIFAMEEPTSGKRRYVTCHLGRFMHHYWRECDPSSRHYYELIREETPCRLYFDLEYSKPANPQIKANQIETLINEFIAELCSELRNIFNITISRKDIVDLDSSTEKKFSRHLIVHIPDGQLFANAVECGVFVKSFVGRLAEEVATGKLRNRSPVLALSLFVYTQVPPSRNVTGSESNENTNTFEPCSTNSKSKTCFVDTGVYTRNRIFRLLGSVKYGKPNSAGLRVSPTNEFPLGGNLQLLEQNNPNEISDNGMEKHATALAHTFVVPINRPSTNGGILPKIEISADVKPAHRLRRKASTTQFSNLAFQQKDAGLCSPFPALDRFVTNVLGIRGGVQGHIRTFEIGYETPNESCLSSCMITYQMKGNRWCENINRSHKSNNIMWIVSVQRMQYWQSCYDTECQMMGFRGKVNHLPVDIQDSIKDVILKEDVKVDHEFENALMKLRLDDLDNRESEDKACSNDVCSCHKQVSECLTLNREGAVQSDDTLTDDELLKEDLKVDQEFENALKELYLSASDKHFDDDQACRNKVSTYLRETKQVSDIPKLKRNDIKSVNTPTRAHRGQVESLGDLKTNNIADESFDGEFGAALLDALSSNPNIFP